MNIVNKKTHAPTAQDVYIGRPSPLGNPYSHLDLRHTTKVANRDMAVELYGRWLLNKIRDNDPQVMQALGNLKQDSVLVCWCFPERCHGEMIQRAWNWLALKANS
jgi:hypothetical protein